jgi:hypothetical protein
MTRMAEEVYFLFGEAGPERVSREEFADSVWPYRERSPAWYAARMAHRIGCLSPGPWADKPDLFAWLKELVEILSKPQLVEQYRRELLTAEELAADRREAGSLHFKLYRH